MPSVSEDIETAVFWKALCAYSSQAADQFKMAHRLMNEGEHDAAAVCLNTMGRLLANRMGARRKITDAMQNQEAVLVDELARKPKMGDEVEFVLPDGQSKHQPANGGFPIVRRAKVVHVWPNSPEDMVQLFVYADQMNGELTCASSIHRDDVAHAFNTWHHIGEVAKPVEEPKV